MKGSMVIRYERAYTIYSQLWQFRGEEYRFLPFWIPYGADMIDEFPVNINPGPDDVWFIEVYSPPTPSPYVLRYPIRPPTDLDTAMKTVKFLQKRYESHLNKPTMGYYRIRNYLTDITIPVDIL